MLRARAPSPRATSYAFHYEHILGTSLELQVVAARAEAAGLAEQVALFEVDRLEQILSGYTAASEVARWLGASVSRGLGPAQQATAHRIGCEQMGRARLQRWSDCDERITNAYRRSCKDTPDWYPLAPLSGMPEMPAVDCPIAHDRLRRGTK